MLSHSKPTPKMFRTKQWFWHLKVIIPQQHMPSHSVAIQSRFMSYNRASKQWPLTFNVIVYDQSRHHQFFIITRLIRRTKEMLEEKLITTVHCTLWAKRRTPCRRGDAVAEAVAAARARAIVCLPQQRTMQRRSLRDGV